MRVRDIRALSGVIIAGARAGADGASYSCIIAWESVSRQALIFSLRQTQQRFSSENGATSEPQTTQPFFLRSGRADPARGVRVGTLTGCRIFFAIYFQLITDRPKDQSPAAGASTAAALRRASQAFTSSTYE